MMKKLLIRSGLCCVVLACLGLSACKAVDDATGANNANVGQSLQQPPGTLTRKELAQKMRRLAMSYLGEVPEACETIAATEESLDKRLLALRIRVNSADSVISIAADPDPQVSLLNMVTILTLQRMLAEERAEEFFGDNGPLYVNAAKRMEDEAWKLAAQVMDETERQQLLELITQYRKDHPNEVYVWWVRFSEFSAYREQFSVAQIGQGIVDIFVPVGGAVQGIENTTDVAERATWLAARQALIMQWRVELTYLQTLSAPETGRILADIEKVSATIDELPSRVALERTAILKAIDEQQGVLREVIADTRGAIDDSRQAIAEINATVVEARGTVAEVNQAVTAAQEAADATLTQLQETGLLRESEATLAQLEKTSDSLNTTLQTLDAFVGQFESETGSGAADPNAPPPRPFDIREYTQAVTEAGKTVAQLNELVVNVDQTAQPTRLGATLDTFEGRASALIWQAAGALALAGLVLILAAKLIPRRQRKA